MKISIKDGIDLDLKPDGGVHLKLEPNYANIIRSLNVFDKNSFSALAKETKINQKSLEQALKELRYLEIVELANSAGGEDWYRLTGHTGKPLYRVIDILDKLKSEHEAQERLYSK